ncbi:MAG: hypothetical protein JO257_21180 [Deltaproteobacteria bacterium]|nr:hypothetical protein [Deltaproteobacteria bacterium]
MNRVLLIVAAIALAIGGWLMFRKEKPSDKATTGSATDTTASTQPPSTPDTSSRPSLPSNVDNTKPVPPPGSANEYTIGDVRVRDHRAGSNAPLDVPPNIHRPNTRQLPSGLTAEVAQKVRGVLADCAKDLPKEARGEHPRLEGTIFVAIKDHKLTVTSAAYQLRDVTGDAVDATKSCVEQKSVGLEAAASDQDDIDNYSIGITFAVM